MKIKIATIAALIILPMSALAQSSTPTPVPQPPTKLVKQPFYLPETQRTAASCERQNAPGPDESMEKSSGPNELSGGQGSTRGRSYVIACAKESVNRICMRELGFSKAVLLSANGAASLPVYENRKIFVTITSASAVCLD